MKEVGGVCSPPSLRALNPGREGVRSGLRGFSRTEGWRRRVAAGAAQRTRLERRKNWLQLEKKGDEDT